MRYMTVVLILIAALVAVSACAADSTKAGDAVGMPPMGAPPEMKQVAFMVGDWDITMKYNMGDTTQWLETKSKSTVTSVLDGAALLSTFEGTMMGMPFKGMGHTCFSRESGKWQMSWVDNMGAALSVYTGTLKDGKLVLTGEEMYQGKPMFSKMTYSNMSDNKFDWTMEMSMDGGKTLTPGMRATYTKVKK